MVFDDDLDLTKAVANAKKNKDRDVSPELVDKVVKGDDGQEKLTGKPNPDSAVAWRWVSFCLSLRPISVAAPRATCCPWRA